MNGHVKVEENKGKYKFCNCCASSTPVDREYRINFTLQGQSTNMKLCIDHLYDLYSEIEEALGIDRD